mmetsp:Transcript_17457/g.37710  ORF Transcript_17457/g.37710 Transcript_17457/m.37710 type:complete len:85 (+) Transcript_17457:351-605(+)
MPSHHLLLPTGLPAPLEVTDTSHLKEVWALVVHRALSSKTFQGDAVLMIETHLVTMMTCRQINKISTKRKENSRTFHKRDNFQG